MSIDDTEENPAEAMEQWTGKFRPPKRDEASGVAKEEKRCPAGRPNWKK